jgi:hypothetical protein
MQLTPFAQRARYSVLEQELFSAMPQNGDRVTTHDLVYARMKSGHWDVKYPRNIVATVMKKLIEKVKLNDESFLIRSEQQRGPNRLEIAYWLEPKSTRRTTREAHAAHSILD